MAELLQLTTFPDQENLARVRGRADQRDDNTATRGNGELHDGYLAANQSQHDTIFALFAALELHGSKMGHPMILKGAIDFRATLTELCGKQVTVKGGGEHAPPSCRI